jgi:FKBP-type peptidyl-prolyl cis-trans isomerase FkpA
MRIRSLMVMVVLAAASACSESVTSPSGQAPFGQTDVRAGTGAAVITGSVVTVHYTGWLYRESATDGKGLQFETSRSGEPFSFTVGVGQVIEGWDEGLPGMRVGGLRRLVIPPSMAYGSFRNGVIPPNATLVFEIELIEVE